MDVNDLNNEIFDLVIKLLGKQLEIAENENLKLLAWNQSFETLIGSRI